MRRKKYSPYAFFDGLVKLFEIIFQGERIRDITITAASRGNLTQRFFALSLVERGKENCHSSYTSRNIR